MNYLARDPMIKIDFQEPDTENWRNWRAECEVEQQKHNEAVEESRPTEVKNEVYKGKKYGIKSDVYMNLHGPFHGKCAYCETLITGHDGEIEHFRPKNAVSDENFNPVKIEVNGEIKDHPGYYWLCYDYKNLLPSCIRCNQKRIHDDKPVGKGTRFPVKGFRATKPGEELKEKPLLINPVFQDPQKHLRIDETGVFLALSEEGEACIIIFGLNIRDSLLDDRKRCYDNIKAKISVLLMEINQGTMENIDECFKNILEGKLPYTAAAQAALKDSQSKLRPFMNLPTGDN